MSEDDISIYANVAYQQNTNTTQEASGRVVVSGKKKTAIVCFAVLLAVYALVCSVAIAVAFVEISRLKSEIDSVFSINLGRIQELENSSLLLDSSITQVSMELSKNITAIDTQIQQLVISSGESLATSCAALPPFFPSGYYRVRGSTGPAVRVYCDMTLSCGNITGGWMRVAELDMTNSSQQCPSGLRERVDNNTRTCGIHSDLATCSTFMIPIHSLNYSSVCGRVRAYQVGSTDTFFDGLRTGLSIDDNYVDGISITHGNPRHHIWTFAAGLDETGSRPEFNCPCTNVNFARLAASPPSFVGNNYFCDTGSASAFVGRTFYRDDPLWDGAGCGPFNDCCNFNTPPWFYSQLPQPTTDDIEMRVCRDEGADNEDIAIEVVQIFIQ